MAKTRVSNVAKSVDFWVHFRSTSSIFGLLVLKKKLKSSPLIAKHISKKKKKKTPYFSKKQTENDFFDLQNGQNTDVNFAKNGQFLDPFSIFEL